MEEQEEDGTESHRSLVHLFHNCNTIKEEKWCKVLFTMLYNYEMSGGLVLPYRLRQMYLNYRFKQQVKDTLRYK